MRSAVPDLSITVKEPGDDSEDALADDLDGNVGRPSNVLFESTGKDDYEPLESKIIRTFGVGLCVEPIHIRRAGLFYINAYGNEINPSPNPDYLHNLAQKDVLIYSCGSLWTR